MGWGTRLTVTRVSEWLNKAVQRSDLGQTKVAQETNKQTSTFFTTYTCWAQCAKSDIVAVLGRGGVWRGGRSHTWRRRRQGGKRENYEWKDKHTCFLQESLYYNLMVYVVGVIFTVSIVAYAVYQTYQVICHNLFVVKSRCCLFRSHGHTEKKMNYPPELPLGARSCPEK